jgi:hypothetical protein
MAIQHDYRTAIGLELQELAQRVGVFRGVNETDDSLRQRVHLRRLASEAAEGGAQADRLDDSATSGGATPPAAPAESEPQRYRHGCPKGGECLNGCLSRDPCMYDLPAAPSLPARGSAELHAELAPPPGMGDRIAKTLELDAPASTERPARDESIAKLVAGARGYVDAIVLGTAWNARETANEAAKLLGSAANLLRNAAAERPQDAPRSEPAAGGDYRCGSCSAEGVKLWRNPHGAAFNKIREQLGRDVTLLCRSCVEAWRADEIAEYAKLGLSAGDQLGGCVPAVPAPGATFWGYTSVPGEAVRWWKSLPDRWEPAAGGDAIATDPASVAAEIAAQDAQIAALSLRMAELEQGRESLLAALGRAAEDLAEHQGAWRSLCQLGKLDRTTHGLAVGWWGHAERSAKRVAKTVAIARAGEGEG